MISLVVDRLKRIKDIKQAEKFLPAIPSNSTVSNSMQASPSSLNLETNSPIRRSSVDATPYLKGAPVDTVPLPSVHQ